MTMADETKNPAPEKTAAITPATPQTAAIVKQPSRMKIGIIPTNINDALVTAKQLALSKMIPERYQDKPQDALAAIMWGAELGVPPMAALKGICVINGTPALFGDLFLSVIQSHPEFEDYEEVETGKGTDDWTWTCTFWRKGKKPISRSFSKQDAITAKLWNKKSRDGTRDTPWVTNPGRMLQMRSRGFAGRDRFADALAGLAIREEVEDYIENLDQPGSQIMMPRREAAPEVIAATVVQTEPLQPRSYTEEESKTRTSGSGVVELADTPQSGVPVVDAREAGKNATILEGKPKPEPDVCGKCGKQLDPNFDHFCSDGKQAVVQTPMVENDPPTGRTSVEVLPPEKDRPEPKRRVGVLPEDKCITNGQRKKLFAVLRAGGKNEVQLYDHVWMELGLSHLHQIPRDEYEPILKWAGGEKLKLK